MSPRVVLNPDEMPKQWYNLAADLPDPPKPYLGPDGNPVTPEMMAPIFPMNLIEQEMSTQRWIDIPDEYQGNSLQVAPEPPSPRTKPGEGAGNTGENLLQERVCQSGRKP